MKGQPRTLLVDSEDSPHGSLTQVPNVGAVTHLCDIVIIIIIHRSCMRPNTTDFTPLGDGANLYTVLLKWFMRKLLPWLD